MWLMCDMVKGEGLLVVCEEWERDRQVLVRYLPLLFITIVLGKRLNTISIFVILCCIVFLEELLVYVLK